MKPKVLVINDDVMQLTVLKTLFEAANTEVCAESSGRTAVDLANKLPPSFFDIIIIDLCMPGLDGYQTCALLRDHVRPSTLIVANSAVDSSNQLIKKTREKGFNKFLSSPI